MILDTSLGSRHVETSMKESNMPNVDERTLEKLPRQKSINLARKKCKGHISKINISQQLDIQFISFYTKESLNSILIIFGLDVFEIERSDFEIDCRTPRTNQKLTS